MKQIAMAGTGYIPAFFRRFGRPKRLSAGEQIFMKDTEAEEIYFLDQGKVRAYLLYPDGTERTLCFVERGNLVGEEAVARPPVRIVCADAATDVLFYAMDGQTLIRNCLDVPEGLPELLALFMKKIELLSSWIFYAQFTRNEEKLACFLYSNTGRSAEVHYTQEQIAAVTGMSRVSVSNCLRAFSESGLIQQQYKKVIVLDRPGLRELFAGQVFYTTAITPSD